MKRGTKVIRSGKVELFLVQSKRKYEWERWLFLVLKFTLGIVVENCVFEIALLYSYGIKLWQKFQKL